MNSFYFTRILRIIFFIPFSSAIAFGCLLLGENAVYLEPWMNVYEAVALASYFMLACNYVSANTGSGISFHATFKHQDGSIAKSNWLIVSAEVCAYRYAASF